MKIKDILKEEKLSLSFEVFPPKIDANFDSVKSAIREIAELKPKFISVTYGAGGGTSKYTLEIAKAIKEKSGVPSLAHLTCVSSSRATVLDRIKEIKDAGIENVMALRGDIPPHLLGADRSNWDYKHAIELVEDLKRMGDFCIGGACYPEVHPESANRADDITHLKEKVDAGCEFLVTQMFFDNKLFYDFLAEIKKAGINVPVIPGIMPITNAVQVVRAKELSGSYIPEDLNKLVEKFGAYPDAMMQAGISFTIKQIINLYANGITHVHVYTMNKPEVARKIMEGLSDILGK
ncbi:MAG: methylenetetrahydrofolate reductase [NAD(P)H] [Clostridia bacterium]|nr:methylenetetrahydrofolate reductase [NAD(P)H] [Clostridia bacterium]